MGSMTDLKDFCRSLPKIELHAHINGSLSQELLSKLLKQKQNTNGETLFHTSRAVIEKGHSRTLDECFAMFKLIHAVVDNDSAVYMVTKHVISDFAEDGVLYLELRSTPRAVQSTGMTKHSYVNSVIRAMKDSMEEQNIIVRFLLAIDHRNSVEEAQETVNLAVEFMKQTHIVVGVDLSGDLSASDARQFLPVFKNAQERGLKIALHLAELPERNDEVLEMLKLLPDRVGHGTFLLPERGGTKEIVDFMTTNKIPLELCLTSNIKSRTVTSFDQHQFKFWYNRGHPCVICTDDKGVFSTNLTNELTIASETFQLSRQQLWDLCFKAIDYALVDENTRQKLREDFLKIKPTLGL